ncbi:MAG: aryl-sulfate sulfotransferase [Candidatus Hodarchaeota archaeon]
MTQSRITSLYVVCLILLCFSVVSDGQDKPPKDGDFGFIERQIGLILNTPKAYEGYTLFAPKHYTRTYLMDNQGGIINTWDSPYEPGQSVHLLPNGHLLHSSFIKGSGGTGGGEGGRIEEYDWEGNLVWEMDYYSRDYGTHHDIEPLPNGNILALVVERKTLSECLAAGFTQQALRDDELLPDSVIEIEPIYPKGGKIVWEWHVWDHLVQDNDSAKPNYGNPADYPARISVECNGNKAPAFWNHMNSIDYNPELDQIMLSVRGCSELWIIDHSTTTEQAAGSTGGRWGKGGDLLYRWGNPVAYNRGGSSDQMLFQQHDCQWIESNCPGEGNILIFNNGLRRLPEGYTDWRDLPPYEVGLDWGCSSVDEIIPPIDINGAYTLEFDQAYDPNELLWTYVAPMPTDFFAEAVSGCQRLPNGNTLICDGTSGVLFEVTLEGEKVWEYVCPVIGDGPIKQGDPISLDHRAHAMNAIFKVHRYDPNYPDLVDKDLTAKYVLPLE